MFQVGDFPTLVESADVNGDGILDIISNNFESRSISVLLGEGDGSFASQFGFFGGAGVIAMQLADFDDDDDLDLALLSQQDMRVIILTNPGDGRFGNRVTYPVQEFFDYEELFSMTIDDFDDDGDLDLVVPIEGFGAVTALWNNGTGLFTPEYDFLPVEWYDGPGSVRRIDLDLDGDLDYLDSEQGLCVYLNNGDDTYAKHACYFSSGGASSVRLIVEDFNADGFPDVAGLSSRFDNDPACTIYMNDGLGGFSDGVEYEFYEDFIEVSFGDLDHDGDPDMVVGVRNDDENGALVVLTNDGNGVFVDEDYIRDGDYYVGDVQLVDIDSDGNLDLLHVRPLLDRVALLMGRGDGSFVYPEQIGSPIGLSEFDLIDLDLDGDDDMFGTNRFSGTFQYALSLRNGQFADMMSVLVGEGLSIRGHADLDNDADPDFILSIPSSAPNDRGHHAVLLNNGDGTFAEPIMFELSPLNIWIDIIDYNADGNLDLIEFANDTLSFYEGDGDGHFAEGVVLAQAVGSAQTEIIKAGDLDQDGLVDLLLFGRELDGWYITQLMNNGGGGFSVLNPMRIGTNPAGIELRDLDLDGDLDLITINPTSDDARVFLNDGQGVLSGYVRYSAGDAQYNYDLADIDSDGDLDLITASEAPYNITLHKNDGQGGFDEKAYFAGLDDKQNGSTLRVGDIDADGYPEILAYDNGIKVYYDQCNERVSCIVDLNGDGVVNFFDVAAFLAAFGAEEPIADFNADGAFNFFDVAGFLELFQSGCP